MINDAVTDSYMIPFGVISEVRYEKNITINMIRRQTLTMLTINYGISSNIQVDD